jgi:hypothetical protein
MNGNCKFPVSSGATVRRNVCDTSQILLGGATVTWASSAYLSATPNVTDDYLLRVGLNDSYSTVANGCWFTVDRTKSTTNWYAITANASTATSTDTGVAFTATTWTNLRIVIDSAAASAKFYINGSLVATNSTNLPTVGIGPMCYVANVASAVTKTVRLDWMLLRFNPATTRGTF